MADATITQLTAAIAAGQRGETDAQAVADATAYANWIAGKNVAHTDKAQRALSMAAARPNSGYLSAAQVIALAEPIYTTLGGS